MTSVLQYLNFEGSRWWFSSWFPHPPSPRWIFMLAKFSRLAAIETYAFHLSPGNLVTNTLLLEFFQSFSAAFKTTSWRRSRSCVWHVSGIPWQGCVCPEVDGARKLHHRIFERVEPLSLEGSILKTSTAGMTCLLNCCIYSRTYLSSGNPWTWE